MLNQNESLSNKPSKCISASAAVALAQKLASSSINDADNSFEFTKCTSTKEMHLNPTPEHVQTITEKLRERIAEGKGECVFDIGVEENGDSMSLSDSEFTTYIETLTRAANSIDSDLSLLHQRKTLAFGTGCVKDEKQDFNYGHVLIRQRPGKVEDIAEIRIAVAGNVDAGKSTLLGVLTKGYLDDGRGKARVNLFRHKHEIDSGRTSSVGLEIMGFDSLGNVITPAALKKPKIGWEDICTCSSKVLSFLDLAGHEKYLKTTVFGMTGCSPDYVMLMIGANAGIIGMTKEHLGLALALQVPVFIVITKIDMCPKNVLESTINQLTKILRSSGCRKIPVFINSIEDVLIASGTFVSERICPIFHVSNVSGENHNLLKLFMNVLQCSGSSKYDSNNPVEYYISDAFSVPGVGTVVSGTVTSGVVHVGDSLLLGPDTVGKFIPVIVKSIQRKRVNVPITTAGQSATFALKKIKKSYIRKGMVLLSKTSNPEAVFEFEAEILVLFHGSTINALYQAMLHCGCVRQTAKIISMDQSVLRTGDRAIVRFRFLKNPEYLKPGTRLLFREGRTKGIGKVVRCIPESQVEVTTRKKNNKHQV